MSNRLGLTAADIRKLEAKMGGTAPPVARAGGQKLDLNKTELEFLRVLLDMPDVVNVWPHGIRLVLGENCRYEPDFLVQLRDGRLEVYEVKAQWSNNQRGMDDSRAKVKMAASLFPFPITIATKLTKKNGGGWAYERFEPTARVIQSTPAAGTLAPQSNDA